MSHPQQGRNVVARPVLVLSILLCVQPALFGAIPPTAKKITPSGGAVNVPTDTTIIIEVGGSDVDPMIRVFEAATGTEVPGKSEKTDRWSRDSAPSPRPPGWVGGYESGGTYLFRPRTPLKARTRYEIRCLLSRGAGACPSVFTTGGRTRTK
jgi:hypothetical protein